MPDNQIANLRITDAAEKQQRFEAYAAIGTTSDVTIEWLRCRARFAYFLRYVRLRDVNKGLIKMELWPYLIEIADDWQTGESFIEGKARQLGYSWLLAEYDVWIATFREYARILSFSINQRESEELLRKVKAINEDLPDWLRKEFSTQTKEHVEWEETHAMMDALPSTGKAGRSYTATLVQTDEWAFHENAQEHYSAYRSAIADGGQHIGISTGNGAFNIFYRYFTAKSPTIPYRKRFNGWRARPDRDDYWYAREREAFLVSALDADSDDFGKHPGLFKRENPETIDEMFEVFIGLVYDCFADLMHVREAMFDWQEAHYRVAGIDPGQGDPFAIIVIGESLGGHAHQFDEFYNDGATSEDEATAYLMKWHKLAPFNGIYVDNIEGTLIATLRARGLPAYPANKERRTGIGHVYGRLFARTLTVAPHCRATIKEYHEYQWRKVKRGQEEWATSTPEGHHGDAMDGTRYALVGLAKGFEHEPVDPREIQPDWRPEPKPRDVVVAVAGGGVRDAGVPRKKPRRNGPNYRNRPMVAHRAGGLGRIGLRG